MPFLTFLKPASYMRGPYDKTSVEKAETRNRERRVVEVAVCAVCFQKHRILSVVRKFIPPVNQRDRHLFSVPGCRIDKLGMIFCEVEISKHLLLLEELFFTCSHIVFHYRVRRGHRFIYVPYFVGIEHGIRSKVNIITLIVELYLFSL